MTKARHQGRWVSDGLMLWKSLQCSICRFLLSRSYLRRHICVCSITGILLLPIEFDLLLPYTWANESGLRALYANCNINCVATFPSTKISSTLEYSSDGVLCLEKWLALLRTHAIQLTLSQYTCCTHRTLLLSRLTPRSILYTSYVLHKNIYMPPQILSHAPARSL